MNEGVITAEDLEALLNDPNLLPREREALQRLLTPTLAHQAPAEDAPQATQDAL